MADDKISEARVDLSQGRVLAQKALDDLSALIVEAEAAKDEVRLVKLRARQAELTKFQSEGTRAGAQVEQDTQALAREGAQIERNTQLELFNLDVLKKQSEEILQQEALRARLQGSQLELIPATVRQPLITPATHITAGEQVAAQKAERLRVEEARITAEKERQLVLQREQADAAERQAAAVQMAEAKALGYQRGLKGGTLTDTERQGIGAVGAGGAYSAEERSLRLLNAELETYRGLAEGANISTQQLQGSMLRLALVESEAGTQMRTHGALTTEFLSALARGETTVREFGYQVGATAGKFAGWTAAAAATYGALGIFTEIGKGAIDSANGVGQLKRTIDTLNTGGAGRAAQAIRDLSENTASPIKEASDAMFQFSRTFHDVDTAAAAARLGIGAFHLDQVKLADSVRLATQVHQQYGYGIAGLKSVFDLLSSSQREYNARLQDMIPLVSTSLGAVKNAGGDLTQLIQLGTILTRTTGLPGGRIGTGLYRSASNVAIQNAPVLEQKYGLPDPGKNYTQFLIDAIRKGAALNREDRTKLSIEIFGRQFGGRFAAGFSPEANQLLNTVTGSGRGALTPAATRGAFDHEFNVWLHTARNELHQFVYALQRLGSALASSGVFDAFGLVVKGATGLVNALTHLAEGFGTLPKLVRDIIEAIVAFKVASVFLTGTRFGRSVQQLPGIRGVTGLVPGLHASDAQIRDQSLVEGTRSGLREYDSMIAKQSAALKTIGVRQAALNVQAQQIGAEMEKEGVTDEQRLRLQIQQNEITAQIRTLKDKEAGMEAELNAQQAGRRDLQRNLTGLTTGRRSQQMSEADRAALAESMGVETAAATSAAGEASFGEVAGAKATAAKTRLAQRLRQSAIATALMGTAEVEAGAAADASAAAARKAALEANTGTSMMQGARNSIESFATRLGDFALALDPVMIGLVGIPLVIGQIQHHEQTLDHAIHQFKGATNEHPDTLAGLAQQAQDLQAASKKGLATINSTEPGTTIINPVGNRLAGLTRLYEQYTKAFEADLPRLAKTDAGRHEISLDAARLKAFAKGDAESALADFPKLIGTARNAFAQALQDAYQKAISKAPTLKSDPFAAFENMTPKDIEKQLQGYEDRSKIFGASNSGGDLQRAALGYTFLANKYRDSHDPQALQAISTAQGNFINTVNKNVQDLLHQAQTGSYAQREGSLSSAIGVIEQAKRIEEAALKAILARDKGNADAIKKAHQAADQVFAQISDQLATVISTQLQDIKSQTDLQVSRIQGFSPEADIARAQETLTGLQQELAKARAEGADAKTLNDLMTQVNNQAQNLAKQRIDNARSLLDAQGQLATASIIGTGPAADMARARQDVVNAQRDLAFDQRNGAGRTKLIQDQAAVDSAMNGLISQQQQQNQQLHQDLAAYIQSKAGLAESKTNDPVQQARIQLNADIAAAATISRSDYKTTREYLTALNDARAKVNNDRTSLQGTIVQTDLRNLAFEHDIQQIGDQQYIDGLKRILQMKHLSTDSRQQILREIYNLEHQSGTLNLDVGNIKLPSVYQIRRAIGLGQKGEVPGAQGTTINHTAVVNVYVNNRSDVPRVGAAIDHHLGTSVRSAMRARGV